MGCWSTANSCTDLLRGYRGRSASYGLGELRDLRWWVSLPLVVDGWVYEDGIVLGVRALSDGHGRIGLLIPSDCVLLCTGQIRLIMQAFDRGTCCCLSFTQALGWMTCILTLRLLLRFPWRWLFLNWTTTRLAPWCRETCCDTISLLHLVEFQYDLL